MENYERLKAKHQTALDKMKTRYTQYGYVRFLMVLIAVASIYFLLKTNELYLWVPFALAIVLFLFIVRLHQQLSDKMTFTSTLLQINKDEIQYLKNEAIPFEKGNEFVTKKHNYAYDLDIFGSHSLFHNINRTATFIGAKTLANRLCSLLSNNEILANQSAIKELSSKVEWRQSILATGILADDNSKMYTQLVQWSREKLAIHSTLRAVAYVLPIIFIIVGIISIVLNNAAIQYIAGFFFIINLGVFFNQLKHIKKELFNTDKVHETIQQYGQILHQFETTQFESEKLKSLQNQLISKDENASAAIQKLSSLLSSLGSVQNMLGAVIMNGVGLYHIHAYHALLNWKNEHAQDVEKWLSVIGEIEMLNSLSNLAYNNPEFSFPNINENYEIEYENLGHPLLNSATRICNDINFNQQPFIILTGSNMSGKSTFLRSLGINMVLSGMGSVVCATKANVHPLPVFVSMRLSDSLADNESYFFAEVKRLQVLMQQLEKRRGFILLDEILRGTNSDDKRSGTVEVIKKLVAFKAIGAIATHDVEVCKTTDTIPEYLINKRFETEIVNNELLFDYKIKDGICQNKSAYFLMKQMDVI